MAITKMKKLSTIIILTSIGIEERIAVMMTMRSCDSEMVFMGRIILRLRREDIADLVFASSSDILWY